VTATKQIEPIANAASISKTTTIHSVTKEHLDGIKIIGSYGTKIDCLIKYVCANR
jgi:hypothetical protein